MRLGTTLGLAALAAAASIAGARAQTSMYVYNFNDATTSTSTTETAANTAAFFSMDKNNGVGSKGSTLTTSFTPTDSSLGTSNVVGFSGTTSNADNGDAAGTALALVSGGSGSTAAGNFISANNGAYLQATADLTGFTNIGFSFAAQATSTGFKNDTFQYSLDGTNFATFMAFTPVASFAAGMTGAVQTFDLSGIAGLNGDSNAAFRIVFDGATSTSGNNRLDNLVISGLAAPPAVPEASTTASFGLLLILGLGGIAIARRRKQA